MQWCYNDQDPSLPVIRCSMLKLGSLATARLSVHHMSNYQPAFVTHILTNCSRVLVDSSWLYRPDARAGP
jgi:hypothetical protein